MTDGKAPDEGYCAYGVTYSSPVPLTGFSRTDRPADVKIRRAPAPAQLGGATALGAFWSATRDEVLIDTPAVVRHHIRREGTLTVDRTATYAANDDLIYGVPIAATLAFAGLSVLHGAGVVPARDRGALLFVGRNGVGKSSLATALALRGGQMLCDNLAAIDAGTDQILLRPGPSVTRLWADMAGELNVDVSAASKVNPDMQKYVVTRPAAGGPAPVAGILVIEVADIDRPELVTLRGPEAIVAVIDSYFRRSLMAVISPSLMRTAATIAASVPIRRLVRPVAGWGPDALADFLTSDRDLMAQVADPTEGIPV
jgi:hypothetical protein